MNAASGIPAYWGRHCPHATVSDRVWYSRQWQRANESQPASVSKLVPLSQIQRQRMRMFQFFYLQVSNLGLQDRCSFSHCTYLTFLPMTKSTLTLLIFWPSPCLVTRVYRVITLCLKHQIFRDHSHVALSLNDTQAMNVREHAP